MLLKQNHRARTTGLSAFWNWKCHQGQGIAWAVAAALSSVGTVVGQDLTVNGAVILTPDAGQVRTNTSSGFDTKSAALIGAGTLTSARSAYVRAFGNQNTGDPGVLELVAGQTGGGRIRMHAGGDWRYSLDNNGIHSFLSPVTFQGNTALFSSAANQVIFTDGSNYLKSNGNLTFDGTDLGVVGIKVSAAVTIGNNTGVRSSAGFQYARDLIARYNTTLNVGDADAWTGMNFMANSGTMA